jgi:hypothetical protein
LAHASILVRLAQRGKVNHLPAGRTILVSRISNGTAANLGEERTAFAVMVNEMIIARVLALIALIGVVAINAASIHTLPFWVSVSLAGFCGGIIGQWREVEWAEKRRADSGEADNLES